jgi:Zn-dependent M28 family amino/carboxypeptidase
VQKLNEDELKRIDAMLNIDQVAVGQTLYLGGDSVLTKTAFSAAKNEGAGDVQPMPANYANASDHASFADAGVKVLFLTRDTDPNNHKAGDTADKVRPELLGLAGNTVIKVIDSLTGS